MDRTGEGHGFRPRASRLHYLSIYSPHCSPRDTTAGDAAALAINVDGPLGKGWDSSQKTRKTTGIIVDRIARDSTGFSANFWQPVDRLLIGRHESNPPSNNHYKESYKSLMKESIQTEKAGIKPLLRVLEGKCEAVPPVWMMRQAGRYLPEYRAVRTKAGGFLDLCFNPELAAEVTLQPVRRFGFDAAILFSDILVVPLALGRKLWFAEGEGPRLEPLTDAKALMTVRQDTDENVLSPIYETVKQVKAELVPETTLIGFCGAPWTVATYMVAGRGTVDQAPAKDLAAREPQAFQYLVDCLVETWCRYSTRGPARCKVMISSAGACGRPNASSQSFA